MIFPILFGIVILAFLALKLPTSAISLSDTNVYIKMAEEITKGKLLYKDMFLTNLPLFPYLSVAYLQLSKWVGSITFFYSTSVFEAALTGLLIYLITKKPNQARSIPLLAGASYLFSTIVLATTDHQTGIFTATLLATLGYFFYIKKKFILAGVVLGLMFVTKGYMLPVLLGFFTYDIYKRRKESWKLIVPAIISIFIVMLPSLIYARNELMSNVFGYTLNRPAGLQKANVFRFFVINQWLFVLAMVYSLINFRKNILLPLTLSLCTLFLLIYQDIYFFYMNMLMPFMCIALAEGMNFLAKKYGRLNGILVGVLLISFSMILNFKTYTQSLITLQKVRNPNAITTAIKNAHPDQIFGAVEITPIYSYLTGVPLLNGMIDTNESIFKRHVYDLNEVGEDIFKKRTVVITLGADQEVTLADGRRAKIDMPILPEIFEPFQIEKKCKKIHSQSVYSEGIINRIHVWQCY